METTPVQKFARIALGVFLFSAGVSHLTWARTEFQAQVPPWVPLDTDVVVILSGVAEIVLGGSLVALGRYRTTTGWVTAFFFVAVFPGNIAQLTEHRDAFGLNSDLARWLRLPFQGVLIFVALWATGAWSKWRSNKK